MGLHMLHRSAEARLGHAHTVGYLTLPLQDEGQQQGGKKSDAC